MWVICSLDESRILGRRESKANTFSLWVGGGPGYTAQEDLKSINRYNMGEGTMIRVWFFHSCIPRPSLVLICSFVLGSPHSSLSLILGPVLWPFLIPCLCLTICISPFPGIWESSLKGKGVMITLASSGCTGASWGSGFPLPALCQGAFTAGDESPRNDMVACFSIVWVLAREYCCQTITWRFVVF